MSNGSIHGHEIMRMIHAAETPMTRADLEREVTARFGPDARFHACAGQNMTLAELLEFLRHRGKVVEVDGYLRTDIGMMCDHE
ncbi:MAG: YecH family protein [Planctomycetes bacterium]|nr:YecH family protein [Planctomycetota bacterium]